jgi:copper transporter 1
MDHMSMGGGDADSCKISMLWNWTTIDACFLASSWHVKSKGMFAVSCIGVAFLTMSLEALRRACREYDLLVQRQWTAHAVAQSKARSQAPAVDRRSTSSLSSAEAERSNYVVGQQSITLRATFLQQTIRAFLHAVTFGVAYIIMLLAMYFNGYIIISIVIGSGLGKFFCDWMQVTLPLRAVNDNRSCQGAKPTNEKYDSGRAIDEPTVCCG